ncbi:MAG TPA: glycosyltransferase family 4 protein [Phycisphaerae bacterium]|jgi:glycosyltransferase involved in cell wall biosynthesis|nr:glycosyltransferase family 4 protein [Phycisphaerae bacterium]
MRILLLAPQPFYQDRGTPIAVELMLRLLSEAGHQVDVVTFHEGRDVSIPGLCIHRIARIEGLTGIRPGFSWKKLVCDLLMLPVIIKLLLRNRYDLVHAVEESAFVARGLRTLLGLPYVYDMDSSLAQQMVEKHAGLRLVGPLLRALERMVVRGATAVVPVCDALAESIARYRPRRVVVIRDVSLLDRDPSTRPDAAMQAEACSGKLDAAGPPPGQTASVVPQEASADQRVLTDGRLMERTLSVGRPLVMYVGNLESYQGVDLLLESFALIAPKAGQAGLVVIGGEAADIRRYERKCQQLDIAERVLFMGPRPVGELAGWLRQADILVSPRIKGRNTPMKVYSYLHSGKPLLATHITSHTQVLNDHVAMLAEPSPAPFSAALLRLIQDAKLRTALGRAGRQYAQENFSVESCRRQVRQLYAWLEDVVCSRQAAHKTPEHKTNGPGRAYVLEGG